MAKIFYHNIVQDDQNTLRGGMKYGDHCKRTGRKIESFRCRRVHGSAQQTGRQYTDQTARVRHRSEIRL